MTAFEKAELVTATPTSAHEHAGTPAPAPYHRYHIEARPAPDIVPHPHRFRVKVKKYRLALMLIREAIHYRGNLPVVLSRPCLYGVFGGPVGGFAPRERLCVGCLRCTTEFPDVVQIYHHPGRARLGDSYFTPDQIDAVHYEAQMGRIPVKGAGYRGRFGGVGWDGMWTDMSEIVRPTRDGIHGREFISTVVDIGGTAPFLTFDEHSVPDRAATARVFSIPLPVLFDAPPVLTASQTLCTVLSEAARQCETLAVMPLSAMVQFGLSGEHLVPLVAPGEQDALSHLRVAPRMVEMSAWDDRLYAQIRARFPECLTCLRLDFAPGMPEMLLQILRSGIHVFHLAAGYHGRSPDGRFVLDLIREAHRAFVEARRRDEVTLLGSGGIVAAEHVSKAIICGLDAVALDTALLAALQAQWLGDCTGRETSRFRLSNRLTVEWGVQRLKNLLASWRDQMLEVMGAMGLREVRRLRGEVGRAMFQSDMEQEAFAGIEGYSP